MNTFRNEYYPNKFGSLPNQRTLRVMQSSGCKRVAEFGILKGATSVEIAKYLNGTGFLHLYDFDYNVESVLARLKSLGHANVEGFGCSSKMLDSYNWPLMKVIEKHPWPIYDYVFIDGAHTWNVDALTFLLCDRLLQVGGYMDFDDYDWSLRASPTLNPEVFPKTAEMYTDEQIDTMQVKKIVDILVKRDPRYVEIIPNKIYQKRSA